MMLNLIGAYHSAGSIVPSRFDSIALIHALGCVTLQTLIEVANELYHLKRIEKDIDNTEKHLSSVIRKCDGIHRVGGFDG
jgi:hypothetical protein